MPELYMGVNSHEQKELKGLKEQRIMLNPKLLQNKATRYRILINYRKIRRRKPA